MSYGGVGSPLPTAVSGSTRAALREEVARFFGFREGAATGGSTTTVVDAAATRFSNDYFNGANLWLASATGAAPEDEDSFVTDFVQSSGTFTLNPALTAAVASGDTYQVYMIVSKAEIDTAIARACRGTDAIYDLTTVTDTVDYDLTNITGLRDSRQVRNVWLRTSGDDLLQPIRLSGWHIEDNYGQLTLRLADTPNSTDDLWVEYQLDETGMTDDATRSNLPMRLIKARALVHLLEDKMMGQDASGRDKYGQLLRLWMDERKEEERRHQPKPGQAQRYDWAQHAKRSVSRADQALGLNDHYKYQP